MARTRLVAMLGALVVAVSGLAGAARAQTFDTARALPGIARVGVVAGPEADPRVSLAATAGYGRTEAQPGESGPHHRAFGTIAASIAPAHWIAFALSLDGRIDVHPDDELGNDRTFVGEPRAVLRGGTVVFERVGVGAEVAAWAPGGEAPSLVPEAISFEGRVLGSYRFAEPAVTVAGALGYRRDRSANTIDDPSLLRQGDRLALATSEFDAVLLGVGGVWHLAPAEVLAEIAWDVLVGEGAPTATSSPLHFAIGGRVEVTEGLVGELLFDWVPSGRPELGIGRPLAPIDPRWSVSLGMRIRLPLAEPEPLPDEAVVEPVRPPDVEQPIAADVPVEERTVEEPARTQPSGELRGIVRSYDGTPVQAHIRVEMEGAEDTAIETGEDGFFEMDLPPGDYTVHIDAEGFYGQRRQVEVEENGVTVLNADLRARRGGRRQ